VNPLPALPAASALVLAGTALRNIRTRRAAPPADGRPDPVMAEPQAEVQKLPARTLRALAATGGDLRPFDLRRARLHQLSLSAADLSGADLTRASLSSSHLVGASLRRSILDHVDLSGADLRNADLSGASLLDTDLTKADLRGADLTGCRQSDMAYFRGATYDRTTRWPTGIRPTDTGAILDHGATGAWPSPPPECC
jgi:uncharacterized protein YjbI with pentapeptide repeats